eukprot:3717153-Rhodomonas_salina.1
MFCTAVCRISIGCCGTDPVRMVVPGRGRREGGDEPDGQLGTAKRMCLRVAASSFSTDAGVWRYQIITVAPKLRVLHLGQSAMRLRVSESRAFTAAYGAFVLKRGYTCTEAWVYLY